MVKNFHTQLLKQSMFEASEALHKVEGTKKIKTMLFHQYSWNSEVEKTWISLIGLPHKTSTAYAANAASMQPQGRYVNCKLGTYWGFRGQPKSAQIVQIVQISTQVVSTLKSNLFLSRLILQHKYHIPWTKTMHCQNYLGALQIYSM